MSVYVGGWVTYRYKCIAPGITVNSLCRAVCNAETLVFLKKRASEIYFSGRKIIPTKFPLAWEDG